MWTLAGILIAFLLGAALATLYHTRIEPAVAALRREKAVLEADANNWKNRAIEAADEVGELRRQIENRIKSIADAAARRK